LFDDLALALCAARLAGDELLELRAAPRGGDGAIADEAADRVIGALLTEHRPDDAVLSEEVISSGDRSSASRVWIIDPLDGTREYGDPARSDWAVHVALWENGDLSEGVVALPAADEVWTTAGPPAEPASRPIRRIAVSRSRPPRWALAVAAELGAEVVPLGSAGAKTAAVLRGEVDAYLHDGGQYEWDSAAPVVVARHHGYHASRADGSVLRYNQPDPYLPDLAICPTAQADELLALIARHRHLSPAGADL
jgi:3'(2'), 5'-bisphosphate nucleotidase